MPDLPDGAGPGSADPADLVLEKLSTEAAIAVISSLPRFQAEVILLRVVAGLDTQAVAGLVGRSPGAVRVAAHRGLRRLAATHPGGRHHPRLRGTGEEPCNENGRRVVSKSA